MTVIKDLKKLNITVNTQVLVLMPHPDDESAYCGGILQKFIKSGAKVRLITLTQGEYSTHRYGLQSFDNLGIIRSNELGRAMNVIGLKDFEVQNFPDYFLKNNENEVRHFIKEEIDRVNPDIILILEPNGIYGHPDHKLVAQVVSEIHKDNSQSFTLLYATVHDKFKFTLGELKMANNVVSKPIKPNIKIQLTVIESLKKLLAFYKHKSQHKVFSYEFYKYWIKTGMLRNEYYYFVD